MRWLSSPPDDDADSTTVFRSPAPSAIATAVSDVEFDSVPLQPVDELVGPGEEGKVAAAHLVRVDAQPITHHSALEVGGEEAIVPAQQEARRHVGPPFERPRIVE